MTSRTRGSTTESDPIRILAEQYWHAQASKGGLVTPLMRAAFQETPAVESIGHFSNGFADCLLRRVPTDEPADELEMLEEAARPGRRMIERMQAFDIPLTPLMTGELMRMVVETREGEFYAARIKKGLHLVGITLTGHDSIGSLDRRMNRLVKDIREQVHHLPDELLGGLPASELTRRNAADDLSFTYLRPLGGPAVRWRGLWHENLNTVDLQYAAYYQGWKPVCHGDVFNAVPLGERFLNIASAARRSKYQDLAQRLRTDLARLRSAIRPPLAAEITKLTLDVQEGAVYIHWLDSEGDFVLGVTLNQHMVDYAEQRLGRLVAQIRTVEDE
jgi:hypothetical protein